MQLCGASLCFLLEFDRLSDDDALDSFLIMRDKQEEVVVARGVALYALYRLYNGIRHGQFCPAEFRDAFVRFTLE